MQRVAPLGLAPHVENVACRPHAFQWLDAQTFVADGTKGEWLIEQCNIDATHIGRRRHQKFVAGIAKQRTARKVTQHRVVLDLDKSHQVGQ